MLGSARGSRGRGSPRGTALTVCETTAPGPGSVLRAATGDRPKNKGKEESRAGQGKSFFPERVGLWVTSRPPADSRPQRRAGRAPSLRGARRPTPVPSAPRCCRQRAGVPGRARDCPAGPLHSPAPAAVKGAPAPPEVPNPR